MKEYLIVLKQNSFQLKKPLISHINVNETKNLKFWGENLSLKRIYASMYKKSIH